MVKIIDNVSEWVNKEVTMEVAQGYWQKGIVLCIDEDEIRGYVDWIDDNMVCWEFLSDLDIVEKTDTYFERNVLDILEKLRTTKSYISYMKSHFLCHLNHKGGGFVLVQNDSFEFLIKNKLIRLVSDIADRDLYYTATYKGLNFKFSK